VDETLGSSEDEGAASVVETEVDVELSSDVVLAEVDKVVEVVGMVGVVVSS